MIRKTRYKVRLSNSHEAFDKQINESESVCETVRSFGNSEINRCIDLSEQPMK